MTRYGLIGVPSSAGAHGPGQEKAPSALRKAELLGALREAGLEVDDLGDLPLAVLVNEHSASGSEIVCLEMARASRTAKKSLAPLSQHVPSAS